MDDELEPGGMALMPLKCKTCGTTFLTIMKCGEVECPECHTIDNITKIVLCGEGKE